MSIHKSLRVERYREIRSVRTRRERVEKLMRNLDWVKKNHSVFGLPKEIIVKLKFNIKKLKEKVVETPLVPFDAPTTEKEKK